jgi:hypothetical protein
MAYPTARSCNSELETGMLDGTYKQVVKDRGGFVEPHTWNARKDAGVRIYGMVEKAEKELPDAVGGFTSRYAVDAPLAEIDSRQ